MPEYSQSTIHMRSPVSRKFSHRGSQWQATRVSRVGGERGAHGAGLGNDLVVALGQLGVRAGQQLQIVVDHGEQLEAEGERLDLSCSCRKARAGALDGARPRRGSVRPTW